MPFCLRLEFERRKHPADCARDFFPALHPHGYDRPNCDVHGERHGHGSSGVPVVHEYYRRGNEFEHVDDYADSGLGQRGANLRNH